MELGGKYFLDKILTGEIGGQEGFIDFFRRIEWMFIKLSQNFF